jgi:hypothetical protein
MENFRNIKTTMYHNLFMIMLLKCCTNIMRWWSARHIPTIGKGKSASNIATTKNPLVKRSHGRQLRRTLDVLWEWEGDFTPCFKISHVRVCNERTVSHFHQYIMYMPYNVGVNNCSISHLQTFTGQWPVFRQFWQWLAIVKCLHLLKLWTAFLFSKYPT